MRMLATASIAVAALAVAGCSSEEARLDAASAAVKATFQEAGFRSVAFQSVTGDGTEEVAFNGVTAKAGDGGTVSIKRLAFRRPDLDPMVRKWTDVGRIEAFGYTLYGGYAPKPKGFKADSASMTGVAAVFDGSPLKAEAAAVSIRDYDSTRPRLLRYSGYEIGGLALFLDGGEVARLSKVSVEASKWADGLNSPLRSSSRAEGTVSLGLAGVLNPMGLPLPADLSFSLEGATDVDLDAETLSADGKLEVQGLGEIHGSVRFGGVSRDLVTLLSKAASAGAAETPKAEAKAAGKPAVKAKPAAKGKPAKRPAKPAESAPPPAPEPTLAEKVMDASGKVTFQEMRLEASGLGWLGAALDAAFGDREQASNVIVPALDSGFRGPPKSDKANVALGNVYLFLLNPSSFSMEMSPEQPVPFGPLDLARYARPGSGLLDDLGFSFSNGG